MNVETKMRVARNLRVLRENYRMTCADAAKKLAIGRCTYTTLEQGHKELTFELLMRVSKVYGISADAIMNCDLQPILSDYLYKQEHHRDIKKFVKICKGLSHFSQRELLEKAKGLCEQEEQRRLDVLRKRSV